MGASLRFSNFLDPPEPVRELSKHLVRAATELSGPLPRWLEQQPLCAMSASTRQLAWAVGRVITRNPDHGFAMAERVPAEGVGSLWKLCCAAPNVGTLHERYGEFSALLLDDVTCSVEHGERSVWLSVVPRTLPRLDRAEEDFRAAMQVSTWRALLGAPALAPMSVHFTYPRPASTRAHARQLGAAVYRFAQPRLRIELSRELWEAPLAGSDPELFERLFAEARAAARALATESSLENRVDALATELLRYGATAAEVAARLDMSVRTLHRRLAERGSSYRELLARARAREAELIEQTAELEAAPRVPARQRAALLGFANPGALRNARKRWRAGRS